MSDNNQTYKADSGKTRLDLVSPTFIEAVGKIRTFGVQKYGDSDSWAKVEPQRYMAALLRHINAYRMGEETDGESGMPHLWHAACNLMFLIDLDKQASENRCKNCGNCVNYDGVRCSIDNVPCSSDDFCGHHELKISKGNTPPKENKCCLNCLLFGECEDFHNKTVVNGCCDKWQSDRVEETKAAISALSDRIPDDFEKSCSNCDYYGKCLRESIQACEDWQYKF